MKIRIIIFFILAALVSQAQIGRTKRSTIASTITKSAAQKAYFVSSSTGSDSNPGTMALPFASITKVNTLDLSDTIKVYFKRGDTFSGTLTAGYDSVTYDAYGSGAKPVISGFTTVTAWTDKGGNIWESTNAVSTLTTCNMVVINGVNTPMGREPDTGYYYYQSHSDNYHITSTNLTGTPDWTGAELAFNSNTYIIRRCPVTAQATSTLTFTQPEAFTIVTASEKFIIQNDIRTLDTQNEWYYNPSTKKISVYSTTQPIDIKVSTVSELMNITSYDYLTVKNIDFEGSNDKTIYLESCNNITFDNCSFNFSGLDGFYGSQTGSVGDYTGFTISNSSFSDNNNGAIGVPGEFANCVIENNTISNTGMIYGSGAILTSLSNNSTSYSAVTIRGSGSTIEHNVINNTGYRGIDFLGTNTTVQYNFVNNFCNTVNDGGGIYTWNATTYAGSTAYSGTKVQYNTVINDTLNVAIYLDDMSNGIEVAYNTVMARYGYGIYLHNNYNLNVHHNTAYNCGSQLYMYDNLYGTGVFDDVTIKHNKFISKNISQMTLTSNYIEKIIAATNFTSDSNYWCRPVDEGESFNLYIQTPSYYHPNRNLNGWQTYSAQDSHSNQSVYPVASSDSIFFVYNSTGIAKDTTLSKGYLGVDGTSYPSGTLTIPAYSSVCLLDTTTYSQLLNTNMLAYWNLDQNSSTLEDQVGSNDMTNYGGVVNQSGKIGQCVQFDNTADYLRAPYASGLMPSGNDFTINAWIKESTLSNSFIMYWKTAASQNITYLRKLGTGTTAYGYATNTDNISYNATTVVTEFPAMQTNNWYMITLVHDASIGKLKVYINGIQAVLAPSSFTGTLKKLSDGYVYIGGNSMAPIGYLDEVALSGKAWSTGMIKYMYNSGTAITYPFN